MLEHDLELAVFDVLIRPMRQEDWQDVLNLIHCSVHALNSKEYSLEEIETIVKMYPLEELSKWKIAYVAQYGNKIIGAIGGYCEVWTLLRIQGLFVHPNYIRRKVGTRLLNRFEESAALEKKIKGIEVSSSLTAQDFYLANGYELTEYNDPIIVPYSTTSDRVIPGDSVPTVRLLKSLTTDDPKIMNYDPNVLLFILLSLLLFLFLLVIL